MYSIRPYGGPRANKMAKVALNLTKEAVSPETQGFRKLCKLQTFRKTDCQIQFAVKMSNAAGRLGTYTHTLKQTTIIIVRMRRVLTTK